MNLLLVSLYQVTVLNNERGFTEKNIRALCDVGRSTKGAHRYGYIGRLMVMYGDVWSFRLGEWFATQVFFVTKKKDLDGFTMIS